MSNNDKPELRFQRPEMNEERSGTPLLKLIIIVIIAALIGFAVYSKIRKAPHGKDMETASGQEETQGQGAASTSMTDFTLMKEGSPLYTLKATEGGWTLSSSSRSMELKKTDSGYSTDRYKISIDGEKTSIKTRDGNRVLKVKNKEDRINIYLGDDEEKTWALKTKDEGKISVKKLGNTVGKLSFSQKHSMIKANTTDGKELCTLKQNVFSPAPAVCLIEGLDEDQSMLLFFVLNTMGQ